jgi:Spy/CpxP family protein refolding chaperone
MKAYRTESRTRLGEIRKMLRDEINAVLTPEQKKKNDEMIHRFEERRKQDTGRTGSDRTNTRDRRGDDPPPPPREK